MHSDTINVGIDLGTTNSLAAVWRPDGTVQVITNDRGSECTPSIVYEDDKGVLRVGESARQALEAGYQPVYSEFKQQMGGSREFPFPTGRVLLAEQLSAEVLQSVIRSIEQRTGSTVEASVITIPAAFLRSEIAATNRAGQLAGLKVTPLCLEPVAAALAYAHAGHDLSGYTGVFDMGGGTTDAAVIRMRDDFELVNHYGDNQLGGKLIDYAILDTIVLPRVAADLGIPDLSRRSSKPEHITACAKLKAATEAAKIRLSTVDSVDIEAFDIIAAKGSRQTNYHMTLTRSDVSRIAEPFVLKAIKDFGRALREVRLHPSDLDRVLLVGGATEMPILQEMVEDQKIGLGVTIERGLNPITVVAEGAAVFARTQRFARSDRAANTVTQVTIQFDYDVVGSEDRPVVAGQLSRQGQASYKNFTVVFNAPTWSSGQIPISNDGNFVTQLVAEPGDNHYGIDVLDGGVRTACEPAQLNYLRKSVFREIRLTNTLGVALADNSVDTLFDKGRALPLSTSRNYRTTIEAVVDDPSKELRIPLVEGTALKADRNMLIGCIRIPSEKLVRNVPVSSQVQFSITVNESHLLEVTAHIPVLKESFTDSVDLKKPRVDEMSLEAEARTELQRFDGCRERAAELDDVLVNQLIADIQSQNWIQEILRNLSNLAHDQNAADLVLNRMRDLRVALDAIEGQLSFPETSSEAREWMSRTRATCKSKEAMSDDSRRCESYCAMVEQAVAQRDVDGLTRSISQLRELYFTIRRRDPDYWKQQLKDLERYRGSFTDSATANHLLNQGYGCLQNSDVDGLRATVRQLVELLPEDKADEIAAYGSTVSR